MLDKQKETTPAIVDEVLDRLRLSEIQAVLKNLLSEKVSIRDLETIIETKEHADRPKDQYPLLLLRQLQAEIRRLEGERKRS